MQIFRSSRFGILLILPQMKSLLHEIYRVSTTSFFAMYYHDEDNELCAITDDAELRYGLFFLCSQTPMLFVAFVVAATNMNRLLRVRVACQLSMSTPPEELPPAPVHSVPCDCCGRTISGVRYKCISCPDFDLCQICLPPRLFRA